VGCRRRRDDSRDRDRDRDRDRSKGRGDDRTPRKRPRTESTASELVCTSAAPEAHFCLACTEDTRIEHGGFPSCHWQTLVTARPVERPGTLLLSRTLRDRAPLRLPQTVTTPMRSGLGLDSDEWEEPEALSSVHKRTPSSTPISTPRRTPMDSIYGKGSSDPAEQVRRQAAAARVFTSRMILALLCLQHASRL
jgi:hypothetical protein